MKLTPPDKKQCQAMVPNGNNFMTFGGVVGRTQCTNRPSSIIKEVLSHHDDKNCGSMSVCKSCLEKAYELYGKKYFKVKEIR